MLQFRRGFRDKYNQHYSAYWNMINSIVQKEIENVMEMSRIYGLGVDFCASSFLITFRTSISSGIFLTSKKIAIFARDLRTVHKPVFTSKC